jgi:2-hydroxychromene-2-carboxylate isomerase
MGDAPARLFCFDLASPLCHLAAERVLHARSDGPLEWLPVSAADLPHAERFEAFRCEAEEQAFREDVQARASALGLPPIRWPQPFPFDSTLAMLAATYAREIGRAVAFAQAAFRQAFAGGHALDREDFVLIAAAACEMHPTAVRSAIAARATARRLREAGELAIAHGVGDLPALVIDGEVIDGGRALLELQAA